MPNSAQILSGAILYRFTNGTLECQIAKRDYERAIAANVKTNPKSFYKYARGKLKVLITVGNLKGRNGTVAQSDKEKAEALNNFFASVFTREDTSALPFFRNETL